MIQVYDKYGKIKSSGLPGTGTVTSFSAGNLSPLFTTAVTSPTSTPNIAFTATSQAQKLFYASPNGASGVPSFRAIVASDLPSLSGTYVPVSRTLTINGTTYDLSADRTWTVTASAAWGSITGTLTAQTDLTTYLSTNYYPLSSNPAGYLTAIPTIQQVLNAGDTATDKKIVINSTTSTAILSLNKYGDNAVRVEDATNDTNSAMGAGAFVISNNVGSNITSYELNRIVNNSNDFSYPTKPAGSYTFATTDDIPTSSGIPHGTASGTDTYTVTISGVTAYADGDAYIIRFTNGNTTSATLNINSLGAISLYRNNDGALIGGDIVDGGDMICVYDSVSSVFRVIGTAPNTLLAYVTNDDSVTITKGMPVYAFGGTGDRMTVKRANNTGDATSAQTVGLVLSASIAAGQKGLIMVQGLLDGLSILPTSTWADGDPVYLGATDGTITNVKPSAPNHLVYLGVVTTASNGSAGRMYVRVQNGYELDEIHNVSLTTPPNNNDVLTYETATSLWKNKSLGTILGYTPYRYVNATRATYLASVIGVAEYTVAQTTIIGGTFSTTDVMKMLTRFSKPAGAGTVTLRVRINTTNTLVGATQIALLTLAAANTTSLLTRTFNLSGATLYGYNFASSLALDLIATNTVQSSTAYTTTNDLYVFFTVQIANAADSVTFELANITN